MGGALHSDEVANADRLWTRNVIAESELTICIGAPKPKAAIALQGTFIQQSLSDQAEGFAHGGVERM